MNLLSILHSQWKNGFLGSGIVLQVCLIAIVYVFGRNASNSLLKVVKKGVYVITGQCSPAAFDQICLSDSELLVPPEEACDKILSRLVVGEP